MDRLSPVTLIAGAGSRFGAARAREFARRSQGGLLLADPDQDALCAIADDLDMQNLSPERVSTLAFDPGDAERWSQAAAFITAQYGRLDFAIIHAAPAPSLFGELVQFGAESADFSALEASLSATSALIRKNLNGGAIVASAPFGAIAGHEAEFAAIIEDAASQRHVRVNALVVGGAYAPAWRGAPVLQDLAASSGGVCDALDRLARMRTPAAHCTSATPMSELITALFSDECPLSGAVLIVDGELSM
jgi:NAD(P)-dependent dehydrogenase (short-subunit alcohol dehydrogenase family)